MYRPRGTLLLYLTLASWFSGQYCRRQRPQEPDSLLGPFEDPDMPTSSPSRNKRLHRQQHQLVSSVPGGAEFLNSTDMATLVTSSTPVPSTVRQEDSKEPQQEPKLSHPKPDDVQVGCKELRSKRYISDGFCTSTKPVTEVVCTGHCLPIRNLPWYAEFIKVWARTKILEWRCVDDIVRRKRVRLLCENGETRAYKIKVVKSCKCKRYMRQQNESQDRHKTNGKHHRKKTEDLTEIRKNESRP